MYDAFIVGGGAAGLNAALVLGRYRRGPSAAYSATIDGLTRESAIYSWGRARKLPTSHLEINVDSASARKRLMAEMQKPKKNRISA